MKQLIVLACTLSVFAAAAQKKNKTAEKFAKTITAADLKTHLYILAGNGRTGNRNARTA
jgi:hypothetical protein